MGSSFILRRNFNFFPLAIKQALLYFTGVKLSVVITLILLINIDAKAQSVSTIMGAHAGGMGNISSFPQTEWSIFNNVAGLSQSDGYAGFSYELRPSLPSANRLTALATFPVSFGVLGGGVFRFGDGVYNEQLISIGFGSSIGITSLGVRASYIQYRAEGFGSQGAVGIDFGGITKLSKQIFIGAWIQNLNQPKLDFAGSEKAPVRLYLTVGFLPIEKFTIATELEKDILYPVVWKTGMEYIIHKKIYARAGFNLNPNSFSCGIGFKGWKLKVDYALQSFSRFNASHQATASIKIYSGKNKK